MVKNLKYLLIILINYVDLTTVKPVKMNGS